MPAFCGAIGGAVALALVGFGWGGWVTTGASEAMATEQANMAVVSALAPICVENFNRSKDATAQLAALKKANAWDRGDFVVKQGWAALPGQSAINSSMASKCAELIIGKKS